MSTADVLDRMVGGFYDNMVGSNTTLAEPHNAKRCRFRGSDLPFCGVKYVLERFRTERRIDNVTCMSEFYTESGNVFHSNTQKWLGARGLAYGKWRCKHCDREFPKDPAPHAGVLGPIMCCGSFAEYVEFEFKHDCGFSGHMDMLLFVDGKFLVTELKQMGASIFAKRTGNGVGGGVDKHHVYQVQTYRGVVSDALRMRESEIHPHVLLWYFDRGNPRTNKRFVFDYNANIFKTEARNFRDSMRAIDDGRYGDVCRRCHTAEDDTFCPYNHLCFHPDPGYKRKLLNLILPKEIARCLA